MGGLYGADIFAHAHPTIKTALMAPPAKHDFPTATPGIIKTAGWSLSRKDRVVPFAQRNGPSEGALWGRHFLRRQSAAMRPVV